MVNGDHVEMDDQEDSLVVQFTDHFLKDLAQFEETLDDEAWEFGVFLAVLVPAEEVKEDAKDACLVTVLKASQH